jgi:hypothetical protein
VARIESSSWRGLRRLFMYYSNDSVVTCRIDSLFVNILTVSIHLELLFETRTSRKKKAAGSTFSCAGISRFLG